jgi:hypothetical protein
LSWHCQHQDFVEHREQLRHEMLHGGRLSEAVVKEVIHVNAKVVHMNRACRIRMSPCTLVLKFKVYQSSSANGKIIKLIDYIFIKYL